MRKTKYSKQKQKIMNDSMVEILIPDSIVEWKLTKSKKKKFTIQ